MIGNEIYLIYNIKICLVGLIWRNLLFKRMNLSG